MKALIGTILLLVSLDVYAYGRVGSSQTDTMNDSICLHKGTALNLDKDSRYDTKKSKANVKKSTSRDI